MYTSQIADYAPAEQVVLLPPSKLDVPNLPKGEVTKPLDENFVAAMVALFICMIAVLLVKTKAPDRWIKSLDGEVPRLSQEELDRRLDEAARRKLDMTGPEFADRWRSGSFSGTNLEDAAGSVAIFLPPGKA